MFKSKRANIITALVLAVALWIYIFGSGATTTTKTLKNIPVEIVNQDGLEGNGLTILSMEKNVTSLTFSGLRSVVSAIKPEDFRVTCDVKYLPQGASDIMLAVNAPNEIKIENINDQTVEIIVDKLVSEIKPIQVEIINDTSDETEPYIIQIAKEETTVTGAKTYVDSVVACKAKLDATKVTEKMQAISVALIPIDINGNRVENVKLETANISITSVLFAKKTVNLSVPVIGETNEGFIRTVEYPKAITIKGKQEELNKIDIVMCEQLDLTEIFESTVIVLEPELPDGIQIASDSENLSAKVTVEGAMSKTFDISSMGISFSGITANTKIAVPDMKIQAIAGGEQKTVNTLKADDFSLSADLSGLTSGTHEISLVITSKVDVSMIKCDPSEITVTIE